MVNCWTCIHIISFWVKWPQFILSNWKHCSYKDIDYIAVSRAFLWYAHLKCHDDSPPYIFITWCSIWFDLCQNGQRTKTILSITSEVKRNNKPVTMKYYYRVYGYYLSSSKMPNLESVLYPVSELSPTCQSLSYFNPWWSLTWLLYSVNGRGAIVCVTSQWNVTVMLK